MTFTIIYDTKTEFADEVLYHFDQLFDHRSQGFWIEELVLLSQLTLPFEACDTIFLGLLGSKSFQIWQFWREFSPVMPPDSGWRDAHLFMAVTGHKPRRVGQNGTVFLIISTVQDL